MHISLLIVIATHDGPNASRQTMKDAATRLDLVTVEKCIAYGAEVNAKNLGDNSKTVVHCTTLMRSISICLFADASR